MKLVFPLQGRKIDGGGGGFILFGGLVNIWVRDCIAQHGVKNYNVFNPRGRGGQNKLKSYCEIW